MHIFLIILTFCGKWSESCSVMSNSLQPRGLYSPWNSPGQNTGVGIVFPFSREIFPTQGSNPGLPHCRWILYQLNHKGNPRILVWVAHPFSGGSSWPRNWTGVSCIAGRFFTNWAIRETQRLFFFFSILHTKKLRHKINGLFKITHIYKWLSLQNWPVRFYKYVLLIPALYCFLLLTLYLTMCSHVHPCNVDNVFIVWGLLRCHDSENKPETYSDHLWTFLTYNTNLCIPKNFTCRCN